MTQRNTFNSNALFEALTNFKNYKKSLRGTVMEFCERMNRWLRCQLTRGKVVTIRLGLDILTARREIVKRRRGIAQLFPQLVPNQRPRVRFSAPTKFFSLDFILWKDWLDVTEFNQQYTAKRLLSKSWIFHRTQLPSGKWQASTTKTLKTHWMN